MLGLSCFGCAIVWIVLGLTIGAVCVHYTLAFWIGVDAPWWVCVPAGAATSGVALPVGLVTWCCDLGGMDGPVWPLAGQAQPEEG